MPRARTLEAGRRPRETQQTAQQTERERRVERAKWFLWHGNVIRADETLLLEEINGVRKRDRQAGRPPSVVLRKLDRALDEFATYVDNNAGARHSN